MIVIHVLYTRCLLMFGGIYDCYYITLTYISIYQTYHAMSKCDDGDEEEKVRGGEEVKRSEINGV